MALMQWDPFAELDALHGQLNSLFNDKISRSRDLQIAPVTDVYREDDKQIIVEVQLPNFTQDEVSVNVHNQALEIKAEHTEKQEDNKKRHYVMRESSTSFYRRIGLPQQANEEDIKANFENGILRVTVPFKELPTPKRVVISTKIGGNKPEKKK